MKAPEDEEFEMEVPIRLRKLRSMGGARNYIYVFTKSGYMNSDTWRIAIEEFSRICKDELPGLLIYLLTDNLEFHRTMDHLKMAIELGIFQFFLPPNCSHLFQPLDDLLFAIFKSTLRIEASKFRWERTLHNIDQKHILLRVCPDSERKAFTRDHVIKSWDNCGVWPFQPEKMRELAAKNAGTATESTKATNPESIEDLAKSAALDILATTVPKPSPTRRVTISVKYAKQFDICSIIAESNRIAKVKEEMAIEKARLSEDDRQEKLRKSDARAKQREENLKKAEENKRKREATKQAQAAKRQKKAADASKRKEEKRLADIARNEANVRQEKEKKRKKAAHTCKVVDCNRMWIRSSVWIW